MIRHWRLEPNRFLFVSVLCVMLICSVTGLAKEKVTVFYRQVGPADYEWFFRQAELFDQQSEQYELDIIEVIPQEYLAKLRVLLLSETPPDIVIWVGPEVAAEYVPQDLLLDLEPLMLAEPSMSRANFYSNALDTGRVLGKQFFLPWSIDPAMLAYNGRLIDEAGLASPAGLAKSKQWTWDTFLAYAKSLTRDVNGDGIPEVYGYSSRNWNWAPNWLSWIGSNGGSLIDPEKRAALISQPPAYEALQWFADLKNVHNVYGGDFLTGTAAMGAGFPSIVSRTSNNVELSVVTHPARRAGMEPAHYVVSAGAFIVKRGKNNAGAWELLKFLMANESMADFVQTTKRVPMKRSVTSLWVQDYQKTTEGAEFAVEAMSAGLPQPYQYPPISTMPMYDIVHAGMNKLLANQGSAQSIMADVGRQLEAYIASVLE
jgi:multiple sugar transport system substrate-binding protein